MVHYQVAYNNDQLYIYIPIITILFVLSPLCILNADKPSSSPQRKIFAVLFLLISPVLPIVADIKPTYTPTNSNKLTISILLKWAQQPTNNHLDILQGSIDPILQYSSRSIVGHQSQPRVESPWFPWYLHSNMFHGFPNHLPFFHSWIPRYVVLSTQHVKPGDVVQSRWKPPRRPSRWNTPAPRPPPTAPRAAGPALRGSWWWRRARWARPQCLGDNVGNGTWRCMSYRDIWYRDMLCVYVYVDSDGYPYFNRICTYV